MNEAIYRFVEAQERERKARERMQGIVNRCLRVAEGLRNLQSAAFEEEHGDPDPVFRQSDHPKADIIRTTDVPARRDIRNAVLEAEAAAKCLQAAIAGLSQEDRLTLWPTKANESALHFSQPHKTAPLPDMPIDQQLV